MKKNLVLSTIFALTLAFAGTSYASDQVCTPIYGGGETCVTKGKVLLDKKVQNPSTNVFVDNLSLNDPRFGVSGAVSFQLVVTNTGDTTLSEVEVKDILPQELTFVSGPGNFDQGSRTLTFKVFNLNANESRTFTVKAKVNDVAEGVTCVVNQGSAKSNPNMSQDNSQLCVEKKVVTKGGLPVLPPKKVVQTPPTGPEALALIGLIPAGLSGIFLRRRASK